MNRCRWRAWTFVASGFLRAVAPLNPPPPVAPTPASRAAIEPPLVAVGDLSARPSPPALGATLEQDYPVDARRRGLSGTAKVRARIDPDGRFAT